MASPNVYVSGVGGSSGDDLADLYPLYTSGSIWYVSSATGADAASPAGKERNKPLATLGQAITNASAGDIIVLLSGHAQTLSGVVTINKAGLAIIGEGTGSSTPTITRNADAVGFDITEASVLLGNIIFAASTLTSTASRIKTAGANTVLRSVTVRSGAYDTGPGFETVTGASQVRLADCTFLATAAQPESAIKVTNALTDLELDGVVLNGATYGWSNPYALNGAAAITRLRATNLDLYGDSDVILATGSSGFIHVRGQSGSARVVWTA